MELIQMLLNRILDGEVVDIRMGLHWTAVVVNVDGVIRCGLASTVSQRFPQHPKGPDIPQAGFLLTLSGRELAGLATSSSTLASSIGMASINALLAQPAPDQIRTINAESFIGEHGKGKNVAIVGRFPFVSRLRNVVKNLYIIEMDPQPGEYGPEAGEEILLKADVIAITAMTLINKTFDHIIRSCPVKSLKVMLGPSTPLCTVMYEYGLDVLSGAIVEKVDNVLNSVSQGASFKQIHMAGVRLVTMAGPGIMENKT
jgi:uncharacterized protein